MSDIQGKFDEQRDLKIFPKFNEDKYKLGLRIFETRKISLLK